MTKIEWCDEVWNPITGCSPISAGCLNCWAKRMANRLRGRFGYPKDDPFKVTFHQDRLDQPFKWKKARRIFVCSMGDLFHDDVQDDYINSVFLRMVNVDRHKYLLLTKRPGRMKDFVSIGTGWRQSMPHVWLGVTAENQQTADERIPILLQIPVAVRFVSVEPMLSAVDLSLDIRNDLARWDSTGRELPLKKIDWIICGAETGPEARLMELSWARDLRDQCKVAGVPFFFKSAGKQETPKDLMIREFPI